MRVNQDRSQPIMRLPVDRVPARVTLEDGRELESWLFVPLGEDVAEVFGKPDRFLPLDTGAGILIVARAVIAAIQLRRMQLVTSDELPQDCQLARVRLRCGQVIAGELRWTAVPGYRRTVDLMNDPSLHVAVHGNGGVAYVAKAHVAWIEEA